MAKDANDAQKVKVNVKSGGFFSLWDIFKCIFLVFIMATIYIKGNELIDKLTSKPEPQEVLTEAQIVQIASNLIQLTNQANEQRFESLLAEMKASEKRYTNAADAKIRDALKQALEFAKENGAQITALGQTVAQMNTSFQETVASLTYKDEEKPSRSFEDYDLVRTMSDGSKLPVGWFKYHPDWEGDDKAVQYHYPLEYYVRTVRTEQEDGTFTHHTEAWLENNFVKSTKGIKFPVDLKDVQWEERPIVDKKWRWNPRLGLGGGFTSTALFPSIDISLASYGRTKTDMDWRFLTVGLGAAGWGDNSDTTVIGSFTPVQYNVGRWIPLAKNIFVGPTMSVDSESDTGYGVSVSVPF